MSPLRYRFSRSVLAGALVLSSALATPSAGAQEVPGESAGPPLVDTLSLDPMAEPVEGPLISDYTAPPLEAPQPPFEDNSSIPTTVAAAPPSAAPNPPAAAPVATVAPSAKVAATVVDNRFQPATLTVAVSSTVTWTNQGNNLHTLTSTDGLFDSGALTGGASFSYTFTKPGTYRLICRQHGLNGMAGQVIVQ